MKVQADSKLDNKERAIITLRRRDKKYKVLVADIRRVYRIEKISKPIPVF